jgi:hypothetical protein
MGLPIQHIERVVLDKRGLAGESAGLLLLTAIGLTGAAEDRPRSSSLLLWPDCKFSTFSTVFWALRKCHRLTDCLQFRCGDISTSLLASLAERLLSFFDGPRTSFRSVVSSDI